VKKTIFRALAMLMVIALLAGAVACGDSGTDTTPPAGSGQNSPAPGQNSPAPGQNNPPPPAGGGGAPVDSGPIRIGVLLAVTGWFAGFDLQGFYEAEILADLINEQGGWEINGVKREVELVLSDLQSDPGTINAAAMYLIDQGIDVVIETNDFMVAGAQQLWTQHGVMHVNKATTMDKRWGGTNGPNGFAGGTIGSVMQWMLALRMAQTFFPEANKLVYVENDTGSNQEIRDYLARNAGRHGVEILPNFVTYPGEAPDMAATALQIIASGADAVITAGTPPNISAILKELRALGSDMPFVTGSTITMGALFGLAGHDAAYNVATSAFDFSPEANTDIYNQVMNKVREIHGEDSARSFSGSVFNSLWIILNLMQQTGATDAQSLMDAWRNAETLETIYGTGFPGGKESYGWQYNQAVGMPASMMLLNADGRPSYQRELMLVP